MPESRAASCPRGPPWDGGSRVITTLEGAGHEAWFVGGCVRDLILGDAVQDVDVTTSALPGQVEALFPRTVAVGRRFGVVIVVLAQGQHVEVATYRSDGVYEDGRRPAVVTVGGSVTAEDDVLRRDFTINALLLSPHGGAIVDHAGGLADLDARVLRTVGEAERRLREDRLRILRGLRFAARLSLAVEDGTWREMCRQTLEGVSRERLVQEWEKALLGPGADRYVGWLQRSGHLQALFPPGQVPGAEACADLARALARLGPGASLAVRQAVWLHTTPYADARGWLESLPMARRQQEQVSWLLAQSVPGEVVSWPVAKRRRLLNHPCSKDLLGFWRCRDLPAAAELARQAVEEQASGPWAPMVHARDLIALGCPPGPRLGRLLHALEDAQLEKSFSTPAGGLALARRWLEAPEGAGSDGGQPIPER